MKDQGTFFGRWLLDVIVAVILVFLVRRFIVEAFRCSGDSMAPTVLEGDRVLVLKGPLASGEIKRGELVVFYASRVDGKIVPRDTAPRAPRSSWVKRVVALPGDKVEIEGLPVVVNGIPEQIETTPNGIDEPPNHTLTVLNAQLDGSRYQIGHLKNIPPRTGKPVTVEAGRYYVLGDNRDRSYDSREFGTIDATDIIGRPWVVYYSRDPATGAIRWGRTWKRLS